MAEKEDGRDLVYVGVGQSYLPNWNAHLRLLCEREINTYKLCVSWVFLLEQLSFTLANLGLSLLLVCLKLKGKAS